MEYEDKASGCVMKCEVGVQSSLVHASRCTQTACLAQSTGTNTESPPSREHVADNCGVAHHSDHTTDIVSADVENSEVLSEGPSVFKHSVFEGLSIDESSVKGAQFGVFASKPLPKGLHFGPFQCVKVDNGQGSGHTWQVRRSGKVFLVEGLQPDRASWMHYVNYAPRRRDQNLVAILKDGEIYYQTLRSIIAGEELLVAYNTTFVKRLLGKRHDPEAMASDFASGIPLQCAVMTCDLCGALFTTQDFLKKHWQHKHPQSFPGNHRCAHCSYTSHHRSHVTRHERTHMRERRYLCQYCDKGFPRRSNLTIHLRTHTERSLTPAGSVGRSSENVP